MPQHQICTDIKHQHKLQISRQDLEESYLILSLFFKTIMDNRKTLKFLLIRTLEYLPRHNSQSNN